ncbi:MAG: GNAT family N-acetyltransferase [Gemmatimonadaceae bacterium]
MSAIGVSPVRTARERSEFIELPFRLYRADPYWVPPLRRDVAHLLDARRHPFYQHATAELFLAREGTRAVGRIAAIRNDLHLTHHAEPVGFFGFFETERDPAITHALLDAAGGWLAERGLSVMRGPANPSLNEECGLLVQGFDSSPVVMMPYNPPWYADLLEGAGFEKAKDLVAYFLGHDTPPERLVHASELLARRHRITIRPLDMKRFWQDVERVRDLYNAAWEQNWGFVPMTDAEFTHLAKQMKTVVDPSLVAFAEVDGELAGFAMALPDLNRALRHMRGRLFPFGWAKALWHSRGIDTLRVLTLGVLEKYRRTGAAEMLYLYLMRTAPRRGITKGEFSWILEDNLPMRTALEKLGASAYKTYRLYDRPLPSG